MKKYRTPLIPVISSDCTVFMIFYVFCAVVIFSGNVPYIHTPALHGLLSAGSLSYSLAPALPYGNYVNLLEFIDGVGFSYNCFGHFCEISDNLEKKHEIPAKTEEYALKSIKII